MLNQAATRLVLFPLFYFLTTSPPITAADSPWSRVWRDLPEPGLEPGPELLSGVEPCSCVDIRTCPAVLNLLKSLEGRPDHITQLKDLTCGFRGFMPFVCCGSINDPDPRINLAPDSTFGQPDEEDPHFVPRTRGVNTISHGSSGNLNMKPVHQPYFSDDLPLPYANPFIPSMFLNHRGKVPEYPTSTTAINPPDNPTRSSSDEDYHHPHPFPQPDLEDRFDHGRHSFHGDPHSSEEDTHPHHDNVPPQDGEEFPHHQNPFFGHRHFPNNKPNKHFPTRPPPPRDDRQGLCPPGDTSTRHPGDVSVYSRSGSKRLNPCVPEFTGDGVSDRTPAKESEEDKEVGKGPFFETEVEDIGPGLRLLPTQRCGVSVDERIVGGKAAELGAFPWIARIGYLRNGSGRFLYRCGGSLINSRYVLTAAHCVTNLPGGLQLATVRLGELDERSDPDCNQLECADPAQDFTPENVTIHPEYDQPKFRNDLALIRLARPANISTYVSPICLPLGALSSKNFTGLKATVAGWGATNWGVSTSSPFLQWVRLGVVPTRQCAVAYERAGAEVSSSRQLCAGGERMADSCEGDSGGPLMRPEQPSEDDLPRYFLIGVVSFGAKNCGTESMPGVYTRVGAYLKWIVGSLRS